jgi:hypothetical protein
MEAVEIAQNPPVRFQPAESGPLREFLFNLHAADISLCELYNATLDLATSDIRMFVEHCPPELAAVFRAKYGAVQYDEHRELLLIF